MESRYLPLTLTGLGMGFYLLVVTPLSWAENDFTAVTTTSQTTTTKTKAKAKKNKPSKAQKPSIYPDTSESKGEREKRLLRECQGRANAGACEGYAR